jgi:hypothetical protein
MRKLALLLAGVVVLAASPAFAQGQSELAEARQATAKFHKVSHAEAAGYASTLDVLGCFQNPGVGGMGVHYLNGALLDGTVEASAPEALVYEMRDDGQLKLVALEYIVPIAPGMAGCPPEPVRPALPSAWRHCPFGSSMPGSGSPTRAGCSRIGTREWTCAPMVSRSSEWTPLSSHWQA